MAPLVPQFETVNNSRSLSIVPHSNAVSISKLRLSKSSIFGRNCRKKIINCPKRRFLIKILENIGFGLMVSVEKMDEKLFLSIHFYKIFVKSIYHLLKCIKFF